ncbi:MAG: hypothetical protein ACSW72_06135, partial [Bacteroidales bacterium]
FCGLTFPTLLLTGQPSSANLGAAIWRFVLMLFSTIGFSNTLSNSICSVPAPDLLSPKSAL